MDWRPKRLVAVLLATLGVLAVVYGGSTLDNGKTSSEEASKEIAVTYIKPSAPLVGDVLTLIASFGYGLYQVLYKKYAALSTDPEVISERLYDRVPINDSDASTYHPPYNAADHGDAVNLPPFGLHANLLTSIIGIFTLSVLWIPIPFLHYLDIEPFLLPPDIKTTLVIAGISLTGVAFNAGFMVGFSSLSLDPHIGLIFRLGPLGHLGAYHNFGR